jgi:hypothetical protein
MTGTKSCGFPAETRMKDNLSFFSVKSADETILLQMLTEMRQPINIFLFIWQKANEISNQTMLIKMQQS